MNTSQYKKLLRVRVPELLEEYITRMEEMFGEEYWKDFQGIGQALYGFGTDLRERYEQSQQEVTVEDHTDEPPKEEKEESEESEDEEDQVESKKGKLWNIRHKDDDGVYPLTHIIRAATEVHAAVLFKRQHPTYEVISIEEVK